MSYNLANNRAWSDALLRAVESEGYSGEFMKAALKLYTIEFIEKKLEEARERKLKNLQKPNVKHWTEKTDK